MVSNVEGTTKKITYVTLIPLILLICAAFSEGHYIYDHLGLDFVFSIIFFVPVTSILFFKLYWYLLRGIEDKKINKERIELLFIASFSFFLAGYTIHFVGNDLDNLLREQVELAYLYDEIIGHITAYFGTISMFMIFVYLQYKNPLEKVISRSDTVILLLLSGLFGLFSAFGVIEGQTPYIGYGFDPIFVIIIYWSLHHKNIKFRQVPLILFVTITAIFTFILVMIYGAYFWGWPQPSEIWGSS